ncbi:hypothetical protein [Burkholderia lata]|uniref:hypothetical protein n=1 Tax=Burkholderia lata (strain ATCC 17760 / DSM 23089 / LMG 22485 / NCIMB 9086 / R18194 / 383) TaxID=482957 RepID=UPI0015822FCF|nr:hypothetical protein [Burkholderia lata]
MRKIEIKYPGWYDELAEFEHEEKGFLEGVLVTSEEGDITLNFYDTARFAQDATDGVRDSGFFYMPNVVVVESVSRRNIEAAAQRIVDGGLVV